ncbi:MAG TPA: hypothetical protein PKI78_12635 [Anaerolineales bacterium]|nr:hypothetical protein [Anaerolineales bacterium]
MLTPLVRVVLPVVLVNRSQLLARSGKMRMCCPIAFHLRAHERTVAVTDTQLPEFSYNEKNNRPSADSTPESH